MFDYFKKFAKHSAIYGIGNGLNRAAAILLIPLYTRVLSTAEYGALEMFYVTASVMGTLLGMNIAHGTLRFFFEFEEEIDRKKVISTSLLSSIILSVSVVLVLSFFRPRLSMLLFKSTAYSDLFLIIFVIVIMQLSREICLAYLRVKERSLLYVTVAVLQLLAQVGINFYMVLVLRLGIKGILLGNMISIFVTWLFLVIITLKYSGFRYDMNKLKLLAHYCAPFVLGAGSSMVVSNADRVMLNGYQNLAMVGIYALGMKFGIVIKDLVIEPFTINFGQSRFAIMKQPDARQIYARVMTYFVLLMMFISTAIVLFSREILVIIASEAFGDARKIIPLVLLPVIIGGMGYIFQTGILIAKKTKYMLYIQVVMAILTIASNRVLIPSWGMYGAAMTNLMTMGLSVTAFYFISERLCPVQYEFNRILKIFVTSVILYFASLLFINTSVMIDLTVKILLMLSFPLVLAGLSFYTLGEKTKLQHYFSYFFLRMRMKNLRGDKESGA
jgi:O-antigen/teichoic acid export membrane protein